MWRWPARRLRQRRGQRDIRLDHHRRRPADHSGGDEHRHRAGDHGGPSNQAAGLGRAATPTAPPPTAATTSGTLDWDGVRYDFGRITGLSSNENQDLITFDRYQLYGDGGELLSAANFTEEPIVVGNSDVPWVNDNPKERTYVLDPEAEVLSLANPGRIACGGNDQTESPEWQSGTVEDLFRIGTPDSDQVSLMFSKEGKVVLVRISQGC